MIPALIHSAPDRAGERYLALLASFRGVLQASVQSDHPFELRAVESARAGLYGVARTYLATERALLDTAGHDIAQGALIDGLRDIGVSETARDVPARVSAHLSASGEHLLREVSTQIERDVTNVERVLRTVALDVDLRARSQGISDRAALIQVRANPPPEMRFYFSDRLSRKWPSQKFVRTAWRQHLLHAYNETYLLTLADHGFTEAEVRHPDSKHHFDRLRFSIYPGGKLPSYAEIREEAFHPNSEAVVRLAGAGE
ncbi:hypothetical protein [Inquilinus sp. OTU3971]|uniref:hypothetical protein n=1 Tax=Inquilinus sp. OTU3971 TaxID=3043855 RepID=UPI00313D4A57